MMERNQTETRPVEPTRSPASQRARFTLAFAIAIAAAASTWFYVNQILRAQQIADAAQHARPRGNLSDLYPRWLGARELLLHGRNPYGPDITQEIQQGYYGRPLDPNRPDDPKDQQGFAYPAYVVFLLAPTARLPFSAVQTGFRWLLFALVVVSGLLWFRVVQWRPSYETRLIAITLMLGWWPMVQGIKLQQLTLLVAGLLSVCGVCLTGGWLLLGGGLLALATIKPQLAWPLVAWLLLWAASDWRLRWRFVVGFGIAMLLLFGAAQLLLPGWLGMFVSAIGQYHQYTHNQSVLVWMFGSTLGRIAEAISVIACASYVWRTRQEASSSVAFGQSFALVLALTVVIVPMFAPYNQVLLVPAILMLIRRDPGHETIIPAIRLARILGGFLVAWPWIASLGLTLAYLWLTPGIRQHVWQMPLWSNFWVPIFIFGLAVVDCWMNPSRSLRGNATAE